jgi:hypothetical protein
VQHSAKSAAQSGIPPPFFSPCSILSSPGVLQVTDAAIPQKRDFLRKACLME